MNEETVKQIAKSAYKAGLNSDDLYDSDYLDEMAYEWWEETGRDEMEHLAMMEESECAK